MTSRTRGRRGVLAIAAGLLILTTAAACGSSSSSSSGEGTVSTGSGASTAAFPVTIEHKFGSTTIDKRPERVVTVGWNDQDPTIALGVIPVATREWFTEYPTYPWVRTALGGKQLPTFSAEIDYEAILKQQPDVIIAIYETITKETYDKLSQIAPTVIQSKDFADEQTPWDVQTRTIGRALGRTPEAEALIAKVQARIDDAKAANPQFAGKTLVVDFGPEKGQHWLIPAKDPRRALFDALGFATQSESEDVSEERLDLLDKDVLFVNGATRKDLLASPAFSRLKVVTEDRTLSTSFETPLGGALAYSGPNALLYALDVLVPQLTAATDGDPATRTTADLS
ncbi:ABC transporter substrate-binding protein [Actinoplanes sp. N902-109]|uniref:ABC transporter substrate-binding protein n=1 Tax=Actinoplanes sp. (strain N902-109) TaxID=649831 RepID=UPI0003296669|nr:ABC transporter substrate-binding protein [Actinoplanes sp. N902-109]AGL15084.1 periplasmic binding protein [Actinoplanes sp. N902-109]